MPCYQPITAYIFKPVHPALVHEKTGRPKVFFSPHTIAMHLKAFGEYHEVLTLPCGSCIGCRLKRASEWSLRLLHEHRYYKESCFLTLTYDDEHLPEDSTLVKEHFTSFIKLLRTRLNRDYNVPHGALRYYMVGEYGGFLGRPHYHAILFGWGFLNDRQAVESGATEQLYQSALLSEIWPHGYSWIGEVTGASCGYVARYTMKKLYGEAGEKAYEAEGRIPPYNRMSKGIGARYFADFVSSIYPADTIIHPESMAPVPVPRYYDKQHAKLEENAAKNNVEFRDYFKPSTVKFKRKQRAGKLNQNDSTPERLNVREKVTIARIKSLRRDFQ